MKSIFLPLLFLACLLQNAHAVTWGVGPTRTYLFCSQVAPLVQNGDTILIDYATYVNDPQVKWSKNNAPSAVEEIRENRLRVFPNPTSEMIHIDTKEDLIERVKIYNTAGHLLQEYFTPDFSIEHLSDGIYIIAVRTNKTTYSHKIIKG